MYLDDFREGDRLKLGSRTVTQDEILAFGREFDPQPFHTDPEAAKGSIFGGLVASGWHTCAVAMRLACDAYITDSSSLGSPGTDAVRWFKPVRPGDTLTGESVVIENRPSMSKPDRGIVTVETELSNQHGEKIFSMRAILLVGRRSQS